MKVLKTQLEIINARRELSNMGASCIDSWLRAKLRRLGLTHDVKIGDPVKSWDVLATINFIDEHLEKNDPILDIGCYASEVIAALHKLGYSNLTGVDLNPEVRKMPFQNSIRYETANFMQTKLLDASFNTITSISVIEHGFDGTALLTEISRLLKPGGFFIASFDYWPEKIDTSNIDFFGMSWMIFSKNDVIDFIAHAKCFGLTPAEALNFDGQDTPIECAGKQYTFGWLVLKKNT